MDCVVIAGGRPATDDPLYPYTNGGPKALLPVRGKPMVKWVIDALQASERVAHVVVVGLDEEALPRTVTAIADQGGAVANIEVGITWLHAHRPPQRQVLIATADIPLLTPEVIEGFVDSCRPYDHLVYYNVVPRSALEERFPGSRRTYVRLKGLEVAGGDLVLVQGSIVETDTAVWELLSNARKHAWQLARIVGLGTLLRLLTRRLTLAEAEKAAGRLIGAPVRAVVSPYPELAMDVDKPHQLELVRSLLGS